ncbi:MAG: NAD(P)H-dependent oxidoreductase, partial [Pseudomonadota bacterium]
RVTNIHDLEFDPDYGFGGYKNQKPLEPELDEVMKNFEWSEHVVLSTPMWWGGLPAKLKGLFDRAFLPGRAFDTRVKPGKMPKPMLQGRTARVIMTSDTPGWVFWLIYRNALLFQVRRQILGFVGIKPSKVTYFSGASHPSDGRVVQWLSDIRRLGAQGA